MKKMITLYVLIISSTAIFSQSIINKLGSGGNYSVTDADDSTRIQINELGAVLWYLAGQDMVLRDRDFQSYGQYDYLNIDGVNGRIGFNILASELPLTSSVHLHGSIATRVRSLNGTGNYAIAQDDNIMIIDKQDNLTTEMLLPSSTTSKGRSYVFKRNGFGTGKINITAADTDKLNDFPGGRIGLNAENSSTTIVSDGSGWWVISEINTSNLYSVYGDVTASDEDYIEVNFTSNTQIINLTLPKAENYEGKKYDIKRNADGTTFTTNTLNIVPSSGEFLDDISSSSQYQMTNDFESVTIRSNGSRWLIISNYGH